MNIAEPVPHRFSRWPLLSGVERGRPIEAHLRALWNRLADCLGRTIGLLEDVYRGVSCLGGFESHLETFEMTTVSVLGSFRQVFKDGDLRLHPIIGRLVDKETLEKMGASRTEK